MKINLFALRGMIASLAIENPEHDKVLKKIEMLIDKLGGTRTIDMDGILELYREER